MKKRNLAIDVAKGLLCLEMVFSHAAQLTAGNVGGLWPVVMASKLASFSGFVFCFGFGCYKAYFAREVLPWRRILITAGKCYAGFAVSGLAYDIFVRGEGMEALFGILLLRDIPGFSEFLIANGVIVLIGGALRRQILWTVAKPLRLAAVSAVLLAAGLADVPAGADPVIGLAVGSGPQGYFPVVQYFPLYLLGCWFARHGTRIRPGATIACAAAVAAFLAAFYRGVDVRRFPPSVPWLAMSACAALFYYGLSEQVVRIRSRLLIGYLRYLGANVLYYLVASNFFLFAAGRVAALGDLDLKHFLGLYVGLLAAIGFTQGIGRKQSDIGAYRPGAR